MKPNTRVQKPTSKITTVLLTTLLIGLIVALASSLDLVELKTWILRSGPLGFLIGIAAFGLLGASPVPSEPLTVLITSAFGPFQAMVITCLGNLLAATVEYLLGGKIGEVTDFEKWRSRLPLRLGKLPVQSPAFLILGRMLPGVGPKTISVISGVYRVSAWRYLWTTFISTLIGAAIFAYGASGLLSVLSQFTHLFR